MTPERLGPYRLGAVVEARAFTVTYRAEHVTLGRRALVKALRPTVHASSPLAAELEREASLLARLGHEGGVPELYELVRTADGLGVAMEDPGGARLSEVMLRAKHLDASVAMAILLELARGVGIAHARGVVHTRLCPSVVELTPSGRVVVMDYASGRDDTARGEHGEAAMAAVESRLEPAEAERASGYLAPEQLLGEAASARSDVFALGAILFELVAGRAPFAEQSRAARLDTARPALPSALVASLPRALGTIVRRCLARAPEDRYASAGELAEALRAALAETTTAMPRALTARALGTTNLAPHRPSAPAEAERAAAKGEPLAPLGPTAGAFAVLFALIVTGGVALQLGVSAGTAPTLGSTSSAKARGSLRVLARPWAEVYVDGALVDTTPIGRPIELTPGRHYVTLKHPNAAEEERAIDVLPGQTVTVDVLMRLTPPARDAGAEIEGPDASP